MHHEKIYKNYNRERQMPYRSQKILTLIRYIFCIPLSLIVAFIAQAILVFISNIGLYYSGIDPNSIVAQLYKLFIEVIRMGVLSSMFVYLSQYFAPNNKHTIGIIALCISVSLLSIIGFFNFATGAFNVVILLSLACGFIGAGIGYRFSNIYLNNTHESSHDA